MQQNFKSGDRWESPKVKGINQTQSDTCYIPISIQPNLSRVPGFYPTQKVHCRHASHMPEPPQLASFDMVKKWLYTEPLLNGPALCPISKDEASYQSYQRQLIYRNLSLPKGHKLFSQVEIKNQTSEKWVSCRNSQNVRYCLKMGTRKSLQSQIKKEKFSLDLQVVKAKASSSTDFSFSLQIVFFFTIVPVPEQSVLLL